MPLIEAATMKPDRDLAATLLRCIASEPAAVQDRLIETGQFEAAADEALRLQEWGVLPREATRDCALGAAEIRAGDQVLIMIGERGTDPRYFCEPTKFDPWRPDLATAVSFGRGTHRCPGEKIARQIAVTACQALLGSRRLSAPAGRPLTLEDIEISEPCQ
jgi:cytochrome P450